MNPNKEGKGLKEDDYRYYMLNYRNSFSTIYRHFLKEERKGVFSNPINTKNKIIEYLKKEFQEESSLGKTKESSNRVYVDN